MNSAEPDPRPWLPYVAPMATFLLLTSLEDWLPKSQGGPHPTYYPIYYAFKMTVVAITCWLGRRCWSDLRPWPGPKPLGLAVALGLVVSWVWVGLDGYYPVYGKVGSRAAFNPTVLAAPAKGGFLIVRMLGLVLIVPFFEELFWRSFVVRWIIDPDDFQKVPIGRVTLMAGAVTAALFALEHPAEWLPALMTGALWAWLLHQSKSVSACFVSHAVANLGLGIYVLTKGQWKYW